MKIRIILMLVFLISTSLPNVVYSVSLILPENKSAELTNNISKIGAIDNIESHGIWLLNNGRYFAKSVTLSLVFKKELGGVVGLVYYNEPVSTYCFWGDIDASGNLFAEEITAREIYFSRPWVMKGKSTLDLSSAIVSTRITLANLLIISEYSLLDLNKDLYTRKQIKEWWNALEVCEMFFTTMESN